MPRRIPPAPLLLVLIASTLCACALLVLAPPWLFPRPEQSMRLCAPLRFERLRQAWTGKRPCASTFSMSSEGSLVRFLREQRRAFLRALESGDANGWVVVMGNEAGDLDSLASSIAYASLASSLSHQHTLPLLLTPRKYMSLRPENALALRKALIPPDTHADIFLHLEELPVDARLLARRGVRFALVDHNTLLPPFRDRDEAAEGDSVVVAIMDHHADDGHHAEASPRIIQIPTGSTTSLVTMFFKQRWQDALATPIAPPRELATLLLSGILIDTGALKPGPSAKTTPTDRAAAEFLWRVVGSAGQTTFVDAAEAGMSIADLDAGRIDPSLSAWAEQLFAAKNDVSGLSTHDLLFRDYKEYAMPTSAPTDVLTVGLSTVPLALAAWLSRDHAATGIHPGWKPFVLAMDAWMRERRLDVAGILTTFNDPLKEASPGDSPSSKTRGKHRRELALFVRAREPVSPASVSRARTISDALIAGINSAGPILDVDVWRPSKPFKNSDAGEALVQGLEDELMAPQRAQGGGAARFGCVWRQGNASSTRKQVAPLIVSRGWGLWGPWSGLIESWGLQKDIIAGIPGPDASGL